MQIPTITPIFNAELDARLGDEIDHKTKPRGSLGRIEALARQLGLIQQTLRPELVQPAILVFAADHGVVAEGVSAYPQSVTWQMVENFLAGGAAINVFARQQGMSLQVIDAGVNHDFGLRDGLIDRKVRLGTQNFVQEAAMTSGECEQAVRHGMALVDDLPGNVLGLGEMGIGNTTAAAALMHVLTGAPVGECVGAGTGLDAKGVAHKSAVIERALVRHAGARAPLEVLAALGGLEIAMMVGAMLRAAEQRRVLLIDGFIVSSALLVAARLQPAILDYCVFCHCSDEQGHRRMLDTLGGRPLLDMGLRLGEGTGCALAWPLVLAAALFLCEMATFGSAQVSDRMPGGRQE